MFLDQSVTISWCDEMMARLLAQSTTPDPCLRDRACCVGDESDDDLLSRGNPHYHRRGLVSRSCSGWEGVVPRRYGRQTATCVRSRVCGPGAPKGKKYWVGLGDCLASHLGVARL